MADQNRTIEIIVKTDKAQKEVSKLGGEIKNTGEEAKKYTATIGDNTQTSNKWLGMLKRGAGILAGAAAVYKTLNAAIKSNTELAQAAARTQAELSAVVDVVVADLGDLIAEFTNLNSETSLVDAGVNVLLQGFQYMSRAFGVVTADTEAYAIKLEEATAAARELANIQFRLSERTAEQQIEVEKARQALEEYRMQSREIGLSELERVQAMMSAREAANALYQEQLQLLNIRREEANAIIATAAGTEQERQAKIELTKIQAEEIRLKTQNIQLTNTLLERTNSMINAISKTTEETEEFDMSIFAGNKIIQQRNEVTTTWGEVTREASRKATDSIQEFNQTQAESAEATDAVNLSLQGTVSTIDQMVNLFKDFSFRNVLSVLFSLLGTVGNFFSGGTFSILGFLGLGGLQGRRGMIVPEYGRGGMLYGPSHEQGGIKYALGGRTIELEGGEAVINKRSMSIPWVRDLASNLNQIGGGVKFANGGITPSSNNNQMFVPVLVTEDFNTVNNRVQVLEDLASIGNR